MRGPPAGVELQAVPVRLGRWPKRAVYLLALALLLSGGGWLLLEHFVRVEGAFGPTHHPAQPWLVKLHGVLAQLAVWGFGALWTFHIRRAWHWRRRRASGGAMFAIMALLSLSGLMLYYVGDEGWRAWSSRVHWILGLAGGGMLLVHAWVVPRVVAAARPLP